MKKHKNFIIYCAITFFSFISISYIVSVSDALELTKVYSTSSPKAGIKAKAARWEYFHRMLRDPATNSIPKGIRQRELEFAEQLNVSLKKTGQTNTQDWQEAGPNDVGGRTRALAIDITDPNTIIAGGASGGIWKSTDHGNSWSLKSNSSTILSVSTVAQDPRPGKTNIWYYGTGEYNSNLAGTQATNFTGDGIYKSTDNGETWNVIPSTLSVDFTTWESNFDYVNKIEIDPNNGHIYVATQGQGIFKSIDEGSTFTGIFGGLGEHFNSDISVAGDGTIVIVVSSPFEEFTPQNSPGVYKSTDGGQNWTNITPLTLPDDHLRSIVEIAPSNNNIGYVLTYTGNTIGEDQEDIRFHKININDGSSEDRSDNMASFPFNDREERISFAWYCLTLAVKPDDENYVLIGATSLFRSTNGFASKPNDAKLDWIGGYHPVYFSYPNFHPDVHSFAFDPTNPNAVWFGHDGGLSYTSNITNSGYSELFPWENKNNGYNVTQFYHISISQSSGDNRIMGGTQDNGTPYFRYEGTIANQIRDVSGGDGAYSYFGQTYIYSSSQNGQVLRLGYDGQNDPNFNAGWTNLTPEGASNQSFINPFVVDPNDENIMYYPAGNVIWRNNQLSSIPDFQNSTTLGWSSLDNLNVPVGYGIFALAASTDPAHVLYYAGSDVSTGGSPILYKLNDANNAISGAVDISILGIEAGAYINDIAINPQNADEILVVCSNYNIVGLYYSSDGGETYTAVEGNLEGTQQNPGPSLRSATILPTENGILYVLATSIGVFSTHFLDGTNTEWTQEGADVTGNVIVSHITSRPSDGRIVAGTHGRGAFTAFVTTGGTALATVDVNSLTLEASDGSGSASFDLSNDGEVDLNYNICVDGNFGSIVPKTAGKTYFLKSDGLDSDKFEHLRINSISSGSIADGKSILNANIQKTSRVSDIYGDEKLINDDGDDFADSFVGYEDGRSFSWYNAFTSTDESFLLDSFEFYMRTDQSTENNVYVAVYDQAFNILAESNIEFELSETGNWYYVNLTPALLIPENSAFYIQITTQSTIAYPAGTDTDAQIIDKSFYYNGAEWVNLNTITGFENGAFLIRAVGSSDGCIDNLLTVTPSSGIIPPGNSETITLTLNPENLANGFYTGVVDISSNGGNLTIPIDFVVDVEGLTGIPNEFKLKQNYPNPFNPSTTIEFSLPQMTNVSLKVFDMLGAEVINLIEGVKEAGNYRIAFNSTGLSSGIYLYTLETDNYKETKKMLLLK